ncbi:tRNA 2-thiouridine(34) synthase MnmA [Fibrobacter succinogenes]|uniref:tRNA-specific 2-thiouridylase MnmA n=1 Tax=Fibrobacter succinogenes TaxID=833 RepID=A0A380S6K1_FIBSU|nr:tRNA 2-thiouridine(34) synthase MnmA [Fibrobacter succinogenes]PWJ35476.1 tRNA-specific 2-thiouridylase [Fibrobacter succinogenes subsp. elongatus]SUQ24131.1 tRNA (5-methylaminomethyl-2-thiouridylate)-methyltransferase [Fibrobacter succinogenes]
MSKTRVAVGMSGGVDSSVAALLLQQQGYEVVGVTLRVLPDVDSAFDAENDPSVVRARAIAEKLGIEHHVANCSDAFTGEVLKRCHADFSHARTPNPCCYCNRFIKFGWMMDYAKSLGAEFLATGHYVRIEEVDGVRRLLRGRDPGKDQSYFLFWVPDERRNHVLTPLGTYVKSEVREIAEQNGFVNAKTGDSQDICFDIYGSQYTEFLKDRFGEMTRPGRFVDEKGKVWNTHDGFHKYTVGQRKGLGVAIGVPAFVKHVDPETGDILVTGDKSSVCFDRVEMVNCEWHGGVREVGTTFRAEGMVRYRQRAVGCEITIVDTNKAVAVFDEPLFAVTPGQCAVFYDGDMVLGGGQIV